MTVWWHLRGCRCFACWRWFGVITGIGAVVFRDLIGFVHNLLFLGRVSVFCDASEFTAASPWGALVILVPVIGGLRRPLSRALARVRSPAIHLSSAVLRQRHAVTDRSRHRGSELDRPDVYTEGFAGHDGANIALPFLTTPVAC